jgi:hypothetical protein
MNASNAEGIDHLLRVPEGRVGEADVPRAEDYLEEVGEEPFGLWERGQV